ncbi:hypothetical protein [Pseudokineococcus lusitanus]|uniref:hypothetical protein n=1 Tax=Pseudokineococcus lusitanus TaxID=763993 RepID=UPI000F490C9E|nr:hypothetical protein [Pseudokineococcus lusitanus]
MDETRRSTPATGTGPADGRTDVPPPPAPPAAAAATGRARRRRPGATTVVTAAGALVVGLLGGAGIGAAVAAPAPVTSVPAGATTGTVGELPPPPPGDDGSLPPGGPAVPGTDAGTADGATGLPDDAGTPAAEDVTYTVGWRATDGSPAELPPPPATTADDEVAVLTTRDDLVTA